MLSEDELSRGRGGGRGPRLARRVKGEREGRKDGGGGGGGGGGWVRGFIILPLRQDSTNFYNFELIFLQDTSKYYSNKK